MRKIATLALFLASMCHLIAQTDSTTVAKKAYVVSLPEEYFYSVYIVSATAAHYLHTANYTDVSLGYKYNHQDQALFVQTGNGENAFDFTTTSSQKINPFTRVSGSAQYQNADIKNVMYNSTSDYLFLYPYIMADTIGGDMKHEKYSFCGAYSRHKNHLLLGADISFFAHHQYRQIDPRPRNITSDLKAKISIGYSISEEKIIALDLNAHLYRQTNNVSFYNEQGVSPEYNMTGLGTYYSRFSGNVTSLFYKGSGAGIAFSFFSNNKKGFSAFFGYNTFSFERIALDLNSLPLTRMTRHIFSAEGTYALSHRKRLYAIGISGHHSISNGKENVIGDPSSSIYPILHSLYMYQMKTTTVEIKSLFSLRGKGSSSWNISPKIGFWNTYEQYIYPWKRMNITNVYAHLALEYRAVKGNTFYSIDIENRYTTNADKALHLPVVNMDSWAVEMVNYQYLRISDDNYKATLKASLSFPLNRQINWSFSGLCSMDWAKNYGLSSLAQIKIGISF